MDAAGVSLGPNPAKICMGMDELICSSKTRTYTASTWTRPAGAEALRDVDDDDPWTATRLDGSTQPGRGGRIPPRARAHAPLTGLDVLVHIDTDR